MASMRMLILAACFFPLLANAETLVVAIGESATIHAQGAGPIRVTSRKAIQVVDQGASIQVWGKRIGSGVITQGNRQWYVHVLNKSSAELYRLFELALDEMMGLTLDIEDGQVTVRGHLLRLSDWQLLARLQQHTGGQWKFRAAIDSEIEKLASFEIKGKSPQKLAAFGLTAQPSTPQNAIRLNVIVAEVMKSASGRLGLSFDDGQSVQILPKLKGPKAFEAKLSFLTGNGQARILARPSIVARPNTEAEFLAGGEFAIRTSSYRSKDVSWKRHGLWLRFKPEWRTEDVVALKIDTEFSQPDFSQVIDGIPSIKTHKTGTNIDLEIGRTLMLAGLVVSQDGNSASGIAGLKELPLIGSLFSSRNYANHHSELMVFINTEVVSTDSDEEIPNEAQHGLK